jgi:hypothetical protein
MGYVKDYSKNSEELEKTDVQRVTFDVPGSMPQTLNPTQPWQTDPISESLNPSIPKFSNWAAASGRLPF